MNNLSLSWPWSIIQENTFPLVEKRLTHKNDILEHQ